MQAGVKIGAAQMQGVWEEVYRIEVERWEVVD